MGIVMKEIALNSLVIVTVQDLSSSVVSECKLARPSVDG